jgi:mRNA interferase MazF
MTKYPKRGEIYWVKLDPTIGSETNKTRPGLILSNNIGNEVTNRVIVAPITSSIEKVYPFEVKIMINNKQSKAMIDQLRVVDKTRLGELLSEVSTSDLKNIDKALKLVLDIN